MSVKNVVKTIVYRCFYISCITLFLSNCHKRVSIGNDEITFLLDMNSAITVESIEYRKHTGWLGTGYITDIHIMCYLSELKAKGIIIKGDKKSGWHGRDNKGIAILIYPYEADLYKVEISHFEDL